MTIKILRNVTHPGHCTVQEIHLLSWVKIAVQRHLFHSKNCIFVELKRLCQNIMRHERIRTPLNIDWSEGSNPDQQNGQSQAEICPPASTVIRRYRSYEGGEVGSDMASQYNGKKSCEQLQCHATQYAAILHYHIAVPRPFFRCRNDLLDASFYT